MDQTTNNFLLPGPPQLCRVILPMPTLSASSRDRPKLDLNKQKVCFTEGEAEIGISATTAARTEQRQKNDQVVSSESAMSATSSGTFHSPEHRSSVDIEGAMVDKAIENVLTLPQEFQEVVMMQKLHNNEIAKFEKCLSSILEEEKEAANKNDAVLQDISSVDRKIYFTKESSVLKQKTCSKLLKDNDAIIAEVEKLNRKMQSSESNLDEEYKSILSYEDKMKDYKISVQSCEASSDLMKELSETKECIEHLQQQKNNLPLQASCEENFSNFKEKIEDQINEIKKLISEDERQIAEKRSQISLEMKRQENVQKSLQVLEKRNAAQLLRMKKQVKEAQMRNRSWNSQIQQLEQNLSILHEKIQNSTQQ
ncbi:rootletin-like [Saccostrea echinata]|uniref:rootletin-like n=1 Tax=Saccostrea echinata TaxID=191078 RepID=UPI002A808561|nr:rootletin-like [Saccostrea echinata]